MCVWINPKSVIPGLRLRSVNRKTFIFHDIILLEGVLRDERTRWGIKILLEVPRSTKKLFY